jgi:hypothetical protein
MDFETAFELLHDDHRRAVVEILSDESPISRHRLTDGLADRRAHVRRDPETERHDPAIRHRARVALHHDHLPRLADAGLAEYDGEIVAATPELDTFVEWFGPLDRYGESSEESMSADDPKPTGTSESSPESKPTIEPAPTAEIDLHDALSAFYT